VAEEREMNLPLRRDWLTRNNKVGIIYCTSPESKKLEAVNESSYRDGL
jgi:hypothetical protein